MVPLKLLLITLRNKKTHSIDPIYMLHCKTQIPIIMSETNKNIILRDLIRIHRERISGYEQLMKWVRITPIRYCLHTITFECWCYITELHSLMERGINDPASSTQGVGDVYKSWRGMKPVQPDYREIELIEICEENERNVYQIYQRLLCTRGVFCSQARKLFHKHLQLLKHSSEILHSWKVRPFPLVQPENQKPEDCDRTPFHASFSR